MTKFVMRVKMLYICNTCLLILLNVNQLVIYECKTGTSLASCV